MPDLFRFVSGHPFAQSDGALVIDRDAGLADSAEAGTIRRADEEERNKRAAEYAASEAFVADCASLPVGYTPIHQQLRRSMLVVGEIERAVHAATERTPAELILEIVHKESKRRLLLASATLIAREARRSKDEFASYRFWALTRAGRAVQQHISRLTPALSWQRR